MGVSCAARSWVGIIVPRIVTPDDLVVENCPAIATQAGVGGINAGVRNGDAEATAVIGGTRRISMHQGDTLTQMRLHQPILFHPQYGGMREQAFQGGGLDAGGKTKLIGESLGDGKTGLEVIRDKLGKGVGHGVTQLGTDGLILEIVEEGGSPLIE